MLSQNEIFDEMNGEFDARLRRITTTSRSAKSGDREITVTNSVAIVETKFSYAVLNRLYYPNFVAIEREFDGGTSYLIFEVVNVTPMHFQMLGMDVSMPTVLRKEYLDTISQSWGRSQETWIDLSAVPIWYMMTMKGGKIQFEHSRVMPLPGSRVHLLTRQTVEKFLCYDGGASVGTMVGFDFPLTINLDNLIRFHAGFFGFSVDAGEPMIYRKDGRVTIGKIGELVDTFYQDGEEGPVPASGIDVVSFDKDTFQVKWAPLQYVYRHRYNKKLLRFKLRTGRSVTVTPAHSVFVLREGRVEVARASDIQRGDHLVGANTIPGEQAQNQKLDLAKFFESCGEAIRLSEIPKDHVPGGFLKKGGRTREWLWRKKCMIPISRADLLPPKILETARVTYKGYTHGLPQTLEIDEEFSQLLGYYAAEGHVSIKSGERYCVQLTIGDKDEHILSQVIAFAKKRGMRHTVRKHGKHSIRITVSNRLLAELCARLVGKGAKNKRVPSLIFNSPLVVRRAFFRAWIEGDYGVTASPQLMSDVLYLLLMEGCVATMSRWTSKKPTIIEGRRVNAGVHYQLKFPIIKEILDGNFRRKRLRAEPILPAKKLPSSLVNLYPHPSHLSKVELRANKSVLDALESRLDKLLACCDLPVKSIEEARHDGVYRTNMNKYFVKNEGRTQATQLLMQLPSALLDARKLAESNLAFLEVLDIEDANPTSPFVYDVSAPNLENFMAGFGGVFCHNTGSGKSNLTSTLVRKVMKREADLSVVVLDVSGEYATHLIDMLESQGRLLSTEPLENEEQLFNSQAVPESLEESIEGKVIQTAFARLFHKGNIRRLSSAGGSSFLDLSAVEQLLQKTAEEGKTGSIAARIALERFAQKFYDELELQPSTRIPTLGEGAREELVAQLTTLKENTHEKSGLRVDVQALVDYIHAPRGESGEAESSEITPESLARELAYDKAPRLNIVYVPEPEVARQTAKRLIDRLLYLRKRGGSRKRILVVLDEAQEYLTDTPRDRDGTFDSNRAVEALLRQGRKYRVHCWLATQRVAHLNVSALQQLHSYFVSTLPRFYDRMVVADSFGLPIEVMERSSQLDTGEWIFVSFKATKQKNVPVFVKTENNESVVADYLKSRT